MMKLFWMGFASADLPGIEKKSQWSNRVLTSKISGNHVKTIVNRHPCTRLSVLRGMRASVLFILIVSITSAGLSAGYILKYLLYYIFWVNSFSIVFYYVQDLLANKISRERFKESFTEKIFTWI